MRDPLYLFACHLAWRREGNLGAYQDLLAGLDDSCSDVRILVESLLHRPCPRLTPTCRRGTLIPLVKVECGGSRESETPGSSTESESSIGDSVPPGRNQSSPTSTRL